MIFQGDVRISSKRVMIDVVGVVKKRFGEGRYEKRSEEGAGYEG